MTLSVGRPRKPGRMDLPDNLRPHERSVAGLSVCYWFWRDPRDGKEKALKCPNDKALAIQRATELNALVARATADNIVANIIEQPVQARTGMPFNAWSIHYIASCEKRNLALNTIKMRKSLINAACRKFGDRPLHDLADDVAAFSKFFAEYEARGQSRSAQAMRSALADLFKEAHHTGALDAKLPNPALLTRCPVAKVKRARLTLEAYLEIFPHCEIIGARLGNWQPNSVLLAIVTGQRREDIASIQFRKGRDWEPAWLAWQREENHPVHPYPYVEDDLLWIVQQKTRALVRIPLALRLDALNITVGEVIDRCRTNIASRYALHHTIAFGNAPVGSPVHINTMTRQFAYARNQTTLEWNGRTPPTFHELRSLSERLYREQGVDTQALLGHRHARMTEVYNDARGAAWGTVGMAK